MRITGCGAWIPATLFPVSRSILGPPLGVQVSYSNGTNEKAEAASLGSPAHRGVSARLVSELRRGGAMRAAKEAMAGKLSPGGRSKYGDFNRTAGVGRLQNEPSSNRTASTPILMAKFPYNSPFLAIAFNSLGGYRVLISTTSEVFGAMEVSANGNASSSKIFSGSSELYTSILTCTETMVREVLFATCTLFILCIN